MTPRISGLWLPLVTPFKDGAVDFASYERLIDHYIGLGVDGLFPLGTTGESPALDEAEVAPTTPGRLGTSWTRRRSTSWSIAPWRGPPIACRCSWAWAAMPRARSSRT